MTNKYLFLSSLFIGSVLGNTISNDNRSVNLEDISGNSINLNLTLSGNSERLTDKAIISEELIEGVDVKLGVMIPARFGEFGGGFAGVVSDVGSIPSLEDMRTSNYPTWWFFQLGGLDKVTVALYVTSRVGYEGLSSLYRNFGYDIDSTGFYNLSNGPLPKGLYNLNGNSTLDFTSLASIENSSTDQFLKGGNYHLFTSFYEGLRYNGKSTSTTPSTLLIVSESTPSTRGVNSRLESNVNLVATKEVTTLDNQFSDYRYNMADTEFSIDYANGDTNIDVIKEGFSGDFEFFGCSELGSSSVITPVSRVNVTNLTVSNAGTTPSLVVEHDQDFDPSEVVDARVNTSNQRNTDGSWTSNWGEEVVTTYNVIATPFNEYIVNDVITQEYLDITAVR